MREFLATDAGRDEVLSAIEAAQRMGIRAVPTFVFGGRYAVQGAQPPDSFVRAMERVECELETAPSAGSLV